MKVKELIKKLQEIKNQDLEINFKDEYDEDTFITIADNVKVCISSNHIFVYLEGKNQEDL